MTTVLVGALAAGTLAWAIRRWRPSLVEVRGQSMRPSLEPGDLVLLLRARRPRRGQVIVLEHPGRPGFELVKRVTAGCGELAPDGRVLGPDELWVEGDAPSRSTDSRRLGPVPVSLVGGRAVAVCWPPARWRLIGARRPPV